MVHTPWFDHEIPFVEAASIGTEKVIRDHATIGIVVTTDGSIGDLPRGKLCECGRADRAGTGGDWQALCCGAQFDETLQRGDRPHCGGLREKYQTAVLPVNCEQLRKDDVFHILEQILYEFPVARMEFYIPKWTEMLPPDHPMKAEIIEGARTILGGMRKVKDIYAQDFTPEHYVSRMKLEEVDLASGCAKIRMEVAEKYYYENMSELAGVPIAGEYELIALVKEMSQRKEAYEKVADAMAAVQVKGYGVVGPGLSDIKMEDPVLIKHGNKFGVRIRATPLDPHDPCQY